MRRLRQSVENRLHGIYSDRELKAITIELCRNLPGVRENDFYLDTALPASGERDAILAGWLDRLAAGEPLQYVVGNTEFCGCRIRCDRRALVPRPETSELVEWVAEENCDAMAGGRPARHLLDIGTGTGCIAIALAEKMPEWKISAWDISPEALALARENCRENRVEVHLEQRDILEEQFRGDEVMANGTCSLFGCIVSNPPYIADREKGEMERNVLEYEPHLALFVPDDDPLVFYRAIARLGLRRLSDDGAIYFEINPLYADELTEMLGRMGYISTLRCDIQGRRRMLKAQKYHE